MTISSSIADLDLVKSAAWAWYERGSGSYDKLALEFDFSRSKFHLKPSRYKQELMAIRNGQASLNTKRASISLLDKYEIERISKQLDIYMKYSTKDKNHGRELAAEKSSNDKFGQKKKRSNGSWLKYHGLICGSSLEGIVSSNTNVRRSSDGTKGTRRVVRVVELQDSRPKWGSRA